MASPQRFLAPLLFLLWSFYIVLQPLCHPPDSNCVTRWVAAGFLYARAFDDVRVLRAASVLWPGPSDMANLMQTLSGKSPRRCACQRGRARGNGRLTNHILSNEVNMIHRERRSEPPALQAAWPYFHSLFVCPIPPLPLSLSPLHTQWSEVMNEFITERKLNRANTDIRWNQLIFIDSKNRWLLIVIKQIIHNAGTLISETL